MTFEGRRCKADLFLFDKVHILLSICIHVHSEANDPISNKEERNVSISNESKEKAAKNIQQRQMA